MNFYQSDQTTSINHADQNTEGTSVQLEKNKQVVFYWTMTGETYLTTSLEFTFSTLQAVVNDYYYRPTYLLEMTINPTTDTNSSGNNISDTFYSNKVDTTETLIKTEENAYQDSEFTDSQSITYQGAVRAYDGDNWFRSGYCSIDISDAQTTIPGEFKYICWVLAEFKTQ